MLNRGSRMLIGCDRGHPEPAAASDGAPAGPRVGNGTPCVLKFLFDGTWQLLVDGSAAASGNVLSGSGGVTIPGFKAAYDQGHNLALEVVEKKVMAYLDGTLLATYTDSAPRLSGRVDLDILGPNDGSAKVEVTVDGAVTTASASTLA